MKARGSPSWQRRGLEFFWPGVFLSIKPGRVSTDDGAGWYQSMGEGLSTYLSRVMLQGRVTELVMLVEGQRAVTSRWVPGGEF